MKRENKEHDDRKIQKEQRTESQRKQKERT